MAWLESWVADLHRLPEFSGGLRSVLDRTYAEQVLLMNAIFAWGLPGASYPVDCCLLQKQRCFNYRPEAIRCILIHAVIPVGRAFSS